jgi:hypothetical protein
MSSVTALIACGLSIATLPQAAKPAQDVGAKAPARDPAEAKRAAFLADVEASALANDLALLRRLDGRFSKPVAFSEAPAGDVLKAIKDAVKASIEVDPRAVGESGGWALKPVSCEGASIRAALDAVVRAISPEYEQYVLDVAAGVLVITDLDGQRKLRAQAEYPLGPLLQRLGSATTAEMGALATVSPAAVQSELVDYLSLGNRDLWNVAGGETVDVSWTGPVATIIAPPSIHHEIRRRLARLDEALPAAMLQWTVRVLEIGANVDGGALDAAIGATEALDKLVQDGSARVVSAPRLLASAGEPAEMRVDGDGMSIEVRIEPVSGKEGRVFVVRLAERRGNGPEPVRTIALRALPDIRSAGVVEIDGKRLLLEATGRSEGIGELLRAK